MNKSRLAALVLTLIFALGLPGLALALIADFDISGLVDDADMQVVSDAYGSHSWEPVSPNWDWRADLDKNSRVDLGDLAIAGRNYGDTFNFHWPRRISNGRENNPAWTAAISMDADVDSRGHVHIVWSDYSIPSEEWVYYTQLDPAGNSVIEDVLIDKSASEPRVAVDVLGNVHIVWLGRSGIRYTRFDAEGNVLVPAKVVFDDGSSPALATDRHGHAHILARGAAKYLFYVILDDEGRFLLDTTRINTQFNNFVGAISPELDIDADDTRHILWYEDTDGPGGDLIYTRIPLGGLPSPNQLNFTHLADWNPHRLTIRADSQGAAHVLWHDYRGGSDTLGSIFWQRINPDGTRTAEKLITNDASAEIPLEISAFVDEYDRIHYVARTRGKYHLGYGMIDRDGNTLVPYQTIFYEGINNKPRVVAIPGGQAMVLFPHSLTAYHKPVVMLSTVADPAANDMTRPDLVLDLAHADASPWIARIIDQATITVTLFNGGWAAANDITLTFQETISGTLIAEEPIPTLSPHVGVTVVRTFDIPDFEDITAMPVRISASTPQAETTLTNNVITLTLGVIPPAHTVDLVAAAFDETYAPDDREFATYLDGGHLTLEVPSLGYGDEITSTRALNGFIGVPLDPAGGENWNTVIRLTLTAPGYTTDTQEVIAARKAGDPYRVTLTPAAPIPLYVNRWGVIHGTVYSGTLPLPSVTVKLDDGRTTTTDDSGQFQFTKVVSGTHAIATWHAGNQPTSTPVGVTTGGTATPVIQMPATTRGYVHGVVTNDLGRPFAGITVVLKGGGTQIGSVVTDSKGYFSFEVPNAGAYATYTLEATCAMCKDFVSFPFGLTAGLPETYDFTLRWKTTQANLSRSADVVSWKQVESFNKLDEDEMWIGKLILYKLFGLVNKFKKYEVTVEWGKYHYYLGLNYSESGGVKTIQGLNVDLANHELYSYEVRSGIYHRDGESLNRTALRVDRVDLVLVDGDNNVIGAPLWSDTTQWYASSPEGIPAWNVYDIARQTPDWSQTAVRVFIRVGKYTPDPDTNHWAPWHPPVAVASLTGSGSGAGADYQVLIWRLSPNRVDVVKSLAYYADVVGGPGARAAAAIASGAATPQAVVVGLDFPQGTPARLGSPFPVDVVLSGATDRPVYALEFDLTFDQNCLRIASVQGAPGFQGPFGYWVVAPGIPAANASGVLRDAAIVRLGANSGISAGRLARIHFTPLQVTDETTLRISNVLLADWGGETYTADQVDTTIKTPVDRARVWLPLALRR